MSIIFFLTEEMLRHMKINVSFGPSSGTDMSNFRPWLMDYIVYFKRLDSRQNELKMYVISIWSRFEWILCKTNTRRTWKKRQIG